MDNTRHVNYGGNTRQLRFSGVYFVWIWYIVEYIITEGRGGCNTSELDKLFQMIAVRDTKFCLVVVK